MKFDTVKNVKAEEFRRLTGVKRETFNKMIEIVQHAIKEKTTHLKISHTYPN